MPGTGNNKNKLAMDQARFESLVHRMEQHARTSPSLYKARVLSLALLGYAYLAVVIVALVGAGILAVLILRNVALVAAKLLFIIVPILFVLLKALWVKLSAPEGVRITRQDSPRLFEILDDLRRRLQAPRIHRVLVTPEFNASISQIPRLGFFGWHRNYLLLGLPLLKSLSIQQLEAVLAHELGHLSGGHARTSNWIYRSRRVWQQLETAIEAEEAGSTLVRGFFKWYVPYFAACSFPLARQNEFEADASAKQLTSVSSAAQALTNVSVMGRYLSERYWPEVHAAAKDMPKPAFSPHKGLTPENLARIGEAEAQRWLKDELERTTTYADTHPCLTERLAAMGAPAEVAFPAPGEAADELLGSARRAELEDAFDAAWRTAIEPTWTQVYENTQKQRERLAVLRQSAIAEPLPVSDLIEQASLEEDIGLGAETALTLRRQAVERAPESAIARFHLSRQLLLKDEAEGVAMMEKVIAEEPEALLAGAQLLRDYWWRRGEKQLASDWHARAVNRADVVQESQEARSQITVRDAWVAHGLDAVTLERLVSQLKGIEHLQHAYLARKTNLPATDPPLYVFGYCVQVWGLRKPGRAELVVAQIKEQVPFPGETFLIHIEGENHLFKDKFRKTQGTQLF